MHVCMASVSNGADANTSSSDRFAWDVCQVLNLKGRLCAAGEAARGWVS
jgi:hypothetical protein